MKITISGAIGSGKSTVSKLLAQQLSYNYYSVGGLMREIANERGIDIHMLSKVAENDPSIDEDLDEKQKRIGLDQDRFVMDSRLGYHFIKDSYKIFLDVEPEEAAKRLLKAKRGDENYTSKKEALQYIASRAKSEKKRYKEYYGISFPPKKEMHLIIDTSKKTPQQTVKEILNEMPKE